MMRIFLIDGAILFAASIAADVLAAFVMVN
jgi:hypothetical protein